MRNPNFRFRGLWNRQFGGGGASAANTRVILLPHGTTSWTFDLTAKYKIHLWGRGGFAQNGAGEGGGGAGLVVVYRQFTLGQVLNFTWGVASNTCTLPNGNVMIANTGGNGGSGGLGSSGSISGAADPGNQIIAGTGSVGALGGQAGSIPPYIIGGKGLPPGSAAHGVGPGGGGSTDFGTGGNGADGMCLIIAPG